MSGVSPARRSFSTYGPWVKKGKCGIGAMGWLLAYRQAYMEGVDILYSTNSLFIGSPAILDGMLSHSSQIRNHLLLPERLASITSLVFMWDFVLFWGAPWPSG
jgi:hypothetical protein